MIYINGFKTKENLINKRFGKLLVKDIIGIDNKGYCIWKCICDCGKEKIVKGRNLIINKTKSCGCLKKEKLIKHNMAYTNIYKIWKNMIQRCYNKKHKSFKYYGGRGIKICDEWLNNFENFYKDMGDKPKGKTLERINNNKDYDKNNCKWKTHKQQANNRRNNNIIEFNGYRKTLSEWSDLLNIDYQVLNYRLFRAKKIWSIERAFNSK